MEIIQKDSQFHYCVQELIADSPELKTLTVNPDEVGELWEMIEKYIQLEKKTVELAEKSWAVMKGRKMLIQEYLISYLPEDEKKHNNVLNRLENIKEKMYLYA